MRFLVDGVRHNARKNTIQNFIAIIIAKLIRIIACNVDYAFALYAYHCL